MGEGCAPTKSGGAHIGPNGCASPSGSGSCDICGGDQNGGLSCGDGPGVSASAPPTGPYSHYVRVVCTEGGMSALRGLTVTCKETGVSFASICGYYEVAYDTPGTKTYSTPGGPVYVCLPAVDATADAGEITGTSDGEYVTMRVAITF